MTTPPTSEALANAKSTVLRFTAAAAVTGAIPVPAVSGAIVAENAVMIAVIASDLGTPITAAKVASCFGFSASVNMIGRAVFIEGARLLGWAAGPLGVTGVSALGATTAALQTWIIGQMAIAVGKAGGESLPTGAAREVIAQAKISFAAHQARSRKPAN
jgi:hypothetical protein